MTRAEQRALEAYPQNEVIVYGPLPGANEPNKIDDNLKYRIGYIEGYEQADKDIKEWIEEQLTILDKQTLLHPDDSVFWGQRNAYKQIKDKLKSL